MKRAPTIPIDQALIDKQLLGAALGESASWQQWLSVLRAAYALPMNQSDRERFKLVAGDREPPPKRVDELWVIAGRRSGKTRVASALAAFIATLVHHNLAPGEVGFVLLLAASRSQANVAFNYVRGFVESSPILRQQIENITANEITLRGGIVIGVHANSFRTIRGRTLLAVIGDETSFWRDESSSQPDVETFRACVPALAAARGIWIGISTGYRKIGLLYDKWRDHFGQSTPDVLVVQAATEQFNPALDTSIIARAMANDPEAAASEWLGQFRDDLAAFLDDATVDAAVDIARPLELLPRPGIAYQAFSDASGGRHDAFTIAIGHREGDRFIADVVRGRKAPFDPNSVVCEYGTLLKQYGVKRVVGDAYAAAWAETAWLDVGIKFERSELAKSQLYLEALPLFVRNVVAIPELTILVRELKLLERRTARSGKDTVDHGRGGHDDYANSLCGLLHLLSRRKTGAYRADLDWVGDINTAWRDMLLLQHVRGGFR
jgi:hypothetical protein